MHPGVRAYALALGVLAEEFDRIAKPETMVGALGRISACTHAPKLGMTVAVRRVRGDRDRLEAIDRGYLPRRAALGTYASKVASARAAATASGTKTLVLRSNAPATAPVSIARTALSRRTEP